MSIPAGWVSPKRIDMTGQRFGRLVVVACAASTVPGRQKRSLRWLCRCDCGVEKVISRSQLISGGAKSCGCLLRERIASSNYIDGRSRMPERVVWTNMVKRCHDTECDHFANYGARGIMVCDAWRADFANFLRDMGRRPSPIHSLDRINNDGNYEPGNCRWATTAEQCRNKRTNRRLTIDGETLCLVDWAKRQGLHVATVHYRLAHGWSERDAVLTPPLRVRRGRTFFMGAKEGT